MDSKYINYINKILIIQYIFYYIIYKYNDMDNVYRLYNSKMKRLKYDPRVKQETSLHHGQRKLLVSEIEWMTNNYDLFSPGQKYVLYIGASPGYHISYLKAMFADIHYILYDPDPIKLKPSENVEIYQDFFKDEDAEKYKNMNLFMISDIRNLEIAKAREKKDYKKYDEIILNDLMLQKKWYETIKPKTALLKFRLPWFAKYTKYLDGDLYFQAWIKNMSAEMRMVPKFGTEKIWDNKEYEEILFHHNMVTRKKRFINDKYSCVGKCYDCLVEANILNNYIKKFKPHINNKIMQVCDISISITLFLARYIKRIKIDKSHLKYLSYASENPSTIDI